MGVLLLIVVTVAVLFGAAAITPLLRPDSSLDATVTFGVVTAAMIALIVEVAGLAGVLKRWPVAVLAFAFGGAAVLACRRYGAQPLVPPVSGVARAARHAIGAARDSIATTALIVLATLAVAWQSVVALTLRPYAYDALTYHLVTVVTWIERGRLAESPLVVCCAHYPLTPELLFTWPMVLTGTDAAVNLVQLFFVVLGGVAVAGIARSVGARGPFVALAGAVFVVTPVVLAQGPTEYVDVIIATCALAALHSTIRFAVTADVRRIVPAALATGLLLGSKGTGVIWAVVLVAALVLSLGVMLRRGRMVRGDAFAGAAVVLLACVALGSFWYVRNVVEHGNPVYPFQVSVLGHVVFDGPNQVSASEAGEVRNGESWPEHTLRRWAADLDFWHQDGYSYEQREGGLGPTWAWLGAPLSILAAIVLLRRRDATSLAVLVIGAMFLLQPYRWWSRFTIPLAGLGAVSIAVAASWPYIGRAVRVAALGLGSAGVALTVAHVEPAGRARSLDTSEVLDLVGASGSARSAASVFFTEYAFVEQIHDGSTIVVDLGADAVRFVYPLFDDDLDRRVVPYRRRASVTQDWVVTARGRPADEAARGDGHHVLVSDRRGVRAWKPR